MFNNEKVPSFKDKIKNWYEVANKSGQGITRKLDKNYSKHLIKPCMMISVIGATGSGKSTALIEFLERKNESFYEITIFSGSTADEPLYNLLQEHIEGINVIDNADELPDLTDMNDTDKKQEKLMVFDDIINLPKKQLVKIQKWFNSARKYGYTCMALAQNFTDLPLQMRRNSMIFILFRLNDTNTINHILKSHNHTGLDNAIIKQMYLYSTKKKGDFFKIDFTDDKHTFTHNFTDVINPEQF